LAYLFLIRLGRFLTRLILGPSFELVGTGNVPRSGSVLIVSNHVGAVDPALIGSWTPRPVWFMAKAELFVRWYSRIWMVGFHAFPVIRHSPDRQALKRALGILAAGRALVLFPEGHRADDGRLQRAQPGAGFLARHSAVPVVPLAITGSERVLGRGRVLLHRAAVRMAFGPPFSIPERNPDGSRMDHQQTADFLMLKIAELLPLEHRGAYQAAGPRASEAV
jgi:1-acyl-sn-glycerol-3-phosphate acyltransferase